MRKHRYVSNLIRILFHPVTGMRGTASRYLKTVNTEYAKNYPKIACFSSDYVTIKILLDGRYELEELDFLASKVFPKLKQNTPPHSEVQQSVCLDIGANIGNHALYLADYFDKIIAIEPHPRAYRLLEMNAELADNVVPVNIRMFERQKEDLSF